MSILEIIRAKVKAPRCRRNESIAPGIYAECRNLYGTLDAEYMTASLHSTFTHTISSFPLDLPLASIYDACKEGATVIF